MMTVVRVEPEDVQSRLLELDVPIEALVEAAKAGFTGRALCNEFDPPFIFGTEAWRHTVRTLRERLAETRRWRKEDIGNYALAVNDAAGLNIVVATGDEATGRKQMHPTTRSPKGLYTEAAIERNRLRQGDLFPETVPPSVVQKAIALQHPTWTFLIHIEDDEIRAELSFAHAIEDGEIVNWSERIILPPIRMDSLSVDNSDDIGPDFDVEVRLKT